MKKVIAVASFVMITLSSVVAFTSCEPGQKTTNPTGTDSLSMQNNNGSMDSTVISDTSHLKNKGK